MGDINIQVYETMGYNQINEMRKAGPQVAQTVSASLHEAT